MKHEEFEKAQEIKNTLYYEGDKLDKFPSILERLLKLKHQELNIRNTIEVCFDGKCCDIDIDKCINFVRAITKQSKGVVTKLENEFKRL